MQFVYWFSFLEPLKCSMHTLLDTYSEGQLRLLALASHIQSKNSLADMKDKEEAGDSDTPPAREPVRKTKRPLSKMTKAEVENYYMSKGF